MKTSLSRILAIAACAAGFALPPSIAADGDAAEPRPAGRMGRALARELDLSPEQRQALKGVMQMHHPVLHPLREQAQTERSALRDVIAAPTLDEDALAAQADRIAATHREIVIASARLRADLRKILTAEQRAKLEGWRAHARTRGKAGRTGLHEWLLEP